MSPADSIKLSRLRLRHRSGNTRRLSVTASVAWALGANGTTPAPYVNTARDDQTGAPFARPPERPPPVVAHATLGRSGVVPEESHTRAQ